MQPYYLGPLIFKAEVSDQVVDWLLTDAENQRLDKRYQIRELLAGHIEEEYDNSFSAVDYLTMNCNQIFDQYLNHLSHCVDENPEGNPQRWRITSAWTNFMKSGEFNPPHKHGPVGASFVLYLDVPTLLQEEQNDHKGRSEPPGSINFLHSGINTCGYTFTPKTGDILVFPSSLAHSVWPYRSDCERVSLAGNVEFN